MLAPPTAAPPALPQRRVLRRGPAVAASRGDAWLQEQSDTAKQTQNDLLRRRAAEARKAQEQLLEELKAQEARFEELDRQLAAARDALRAASAASADFPPAPPPATSPSPSPLARDPWAQALAEPVAPPGGTVSFKLPAAKPAPAPVEPEIATAATTSPLASLTEALAGAAPPAWGALQSLAAAAASTVDRLRAPDAATQRRMRDGERLQLKSDLLVAVAPLERGGAGTAEQHVAVGALLAKLVALNPTAAPAASPLADGRWNCVYTTGAMLLGRSLPPLLRPAGPLLLSLCSASGAAALDFTWPPRAERARLTSDGVRTLDLQFASVRLFGFLSLPLGAAREYSSLRVDYLDVDLLLATGAGGETYAFISQDPFFRLEDQGWAKQLPPPKKRG